MRPSLSSCGESTLLSCLTILVVRNLRWRRREKLVSAIRTSFHLISALEVRMNLTECLGGDRQAEQAVEVGREQGNVIR